MRPLLDTHILIWWLADDRRLSARARDLIADPANDVLVSVASLWEMAIKQRIGKLTIDLARVVAEIQRQGMLMLPIELPHLRRLAAIQLDHRDPFDHLLLAQAAEEGAKLVTEDRRLVVHGSQTIDGGA